MSTVVVGVPTFTPSLSSSSSIAWRSGLRIAMGIASNDVMSVTTFEVAVVPGVMTGRYNPLLRMVGHTLTTMPQISPTTMDQGFVWANVAHHQFAGKNIRDSQTFLRCRTRSDPSNRRATVPRYGWANVVVVGEYQSASPDPATSFHLQAAVSLSHFLAISGGWYASALNWNARKSG